MDLNLQTEVKIGLGSSQGVGLMCSGFGSRVLLLTEALYCTSREKDILRLSLERANIKTIAMEFLDGDDPYEFLNLIRKMSRGARADAILAFGGNRILHLARYLVSEQTLENVQKLVLIPAVPGFPFLLRHEGFWGSGHPTDSKFYQWNSPLVPSIVVDPFLSVNMGAKQSLAHLLQTLFFLLEAVFHEQAGLLIKSLCLGAIRSLWAALEKIYEQPTKAEIRLEGFEAGLAAALAQHLLPRLAGSAAVLILEGISFVPQGMAGAILTPWLLESQTAAFPETLQEVAACFGLAIDDDSPETMGLELGRLVRKMFGKFELPLRLRDLDLVEAELQHTAELVKDWKTPAGGIIPVDHLPVFLRSAF